MLIIGGLATLLYVTYLLLGTSAFTKGAQKAGERALAQKAAAAPAAKPGAIGSARPASEPKLGEALFWISIPKIALRSVVVQGVGEEELKRGPGHFVGAPWPGEPGNVPISGHRTTYGAPFFNLDKLEAGDPINIETGNARYKYRVAEKLVVDPTQVEVVEYRGKNELTLTTCNPKFSAAQRLIIHADYLGAEPLAAPAVAGIPSLRSKVAQPAPAIPVDVFYLAGLALASILAAMWLAPRLRRAAYWGAGSAVAAAALWLVIFPQVLKAMPPNY